MKIRPILVLISALVLANHVQCETLLALSKGNSDLVSSTGARMTPKGTYSQIFSANQGFFWATTNEEENFSACLVAPNGSNITDRVYEFFIDEIMRTTPKFQNQKSYAITARKVVDGNIRDVAILRNGDSYVTGHGYGNEKWLAIRMQDRECLLDIESQSILSNVNYEAIGGCGAFPLVKESGKWGILDAERNNIVLPLEYDGISCVGTEKSLSMIVYSNGNAGLYSPCKGWLLPLSNHSFGRTDESGRFLIFKKQGKCGVVNLEEGRKSIDCIFTSITDISSRVAACADTGSVALISLQTGKPLVEGKQHFQLYWCGYNDCPVEIWAKFIDKSANKSFIFIGDQGIIWEQSLTDVIPLYGDGSSCNDVIGFLMRDDRLGLQGVRSLNGEEEIVPMQKDFCIYAWGRHIKLRNASTRILTIISTNSIVKLAPDAKASILDDIDSSGYARIVCDGKAGLIDGDCDFALPCEYEDVGHFGEGLVPAKHGGKWGFVGLSGEWAVNPGFDGAREFMGGYAPVCRDGKWGFIGKDGKPRTPFAYEDVKDVRDGHFRAKTGGKWGIFALDGTCKLPAEYDDILADDEYGYGEP